jgi:hypothetical protein
MNICYLDFWPGFDPNSNWFNLVFKDCFNKEFNFNSSPKEADIIFASSFGKERFKHKNSKAVKIFYTGENERAEFAFADYTLSFDFDTYSGRNFRLPHWYLYVNWWNEPNFPHARISLDQMNHKWEPKEIWDRENFCAIVIGNAVQNRFDVASKLNEFKGVHTFGRAFGNPYEGCKVKLLENYRWNICFENSITDGYTTEKLFEAKIAGCIPIYYGPQSTALDFNDRCYINYADYDSTESILDTIVRYERSLNAFSSIASQPLFHRTPDLNGLYSFLRYIIGK